MECLAKDFAPKPPGFSPVLFLSSSMILVPWGNRRSPRFCHIARAALARCSPAENVVFLFFFGFAFRLYSITKPILGEVPSRHSPVSLNALFVRLHYRSPIGFGATPVFTVGG